MDDRQALVDRLRRMGEEPVDPGLAGRHLSAMAVVTPRTTGLVPKLKLAGVFLAGLLIGGTGLASAGALGPAQGAAHDALGQVGIDVPDGKGAKSATHGSERGPERYNDAEECTDADGNPIPNLRNHGQYVRSQPNGDRSAAAQSPCGKPLPSLAGDDPTIEGDEDDPAADGSGGPPDHAPAGGRPDHAGPPETTPEVPSTAGERGNGDPSGTGGPPESTPGSVPGAPGGGASDNPGKSGEHRPSG